MAGGLSFNGTVGVSCEQLSDLFFNFEKPNLNAVMSGNNPEGPEGAEEADAYSEDARAALSLDAQSFCSIIGDLEDSVKGGALVTPEALVDDFLARL